MHLDHKDVQPSKAGPMKNTTSLIQKLLSSVLALLVAIPPAQALDITSTTFMGDAGIGSAARGPVWNYLAEKLYEGETKPTHLEEKEKLSKLLFADYLDYLNAIGIELASYENSIQGRKEIRDSGECSDETLKSYNQILSNSAASDLSTFTNAYCNSACRSKAEFDFAKIAHFAEPENGVQSCEDKAKEVYDSFHCNELGTKQDDVFNASLADMADIPLPAAGDFGTASEMNFGSDFSGASIESGDSLIGTSGHGAGSFGSGARSGSSLPKLPKLSLITPGGIDLKSSKTAAIDGDFKALLSKKKAGCKKSESEILRQAFSQSDGSTKGKIDSSIRNPLDPRWTSVSEDQDPKKEALDNRQKNPACDMTEADQMDHFSKLRIGYNRISIEKIYSSLAAWPIFDNNDHIQKEYLRLITTTSDQLFLRLIDDIETNYRSVCNAGGSKAMISAVSEGTVQIGDKKLEVISRGGPGDVDLNAGEDKRNAELATVATYFNGNSSLAESFINGVFGATQTGADSPVEFRAGEIAKGVQDGTISADEIGKEAAKGSTKNLAEDVERRTRQYLEQGEYRELKVMASEIAGGVTSGALLGAGVKGAASLAKGTLGGGRLSTLLTSVKEIVMRPMLEGIETGAVQLGKGVPTENQIAKFTLQLAKYGKQSLIKSRTSIQILHDQHVAKLAWIKESGGYFSSVEREIRNFERELAAIDIVLGR